MASDHLPPHGEPVDLEGSTAMTGLLPPVTVEAAEAIGQASEALASAMEEAPASAILDEAAGAVVRQGDTSGEAAAPLDLLHQQQAEYQADRSVETIQAHADRTQAATLHATASIEESFRGASDVVLAFNRKVAESMRSNIEATVEFWTSMMRTRSLSEAVALNAQHIRKQMEALASQSRELSGIAQKLAAQSIEPLHQSFFGALEPK